MVQWFIVILVYNFAIVRFSLSEVTLSLNLLHYKNRHGLTYENRPCDSKLEDDINRDGRCDTAFLFCLVRLPFQNPHNCTLGDHFTGFVGADEIHFVNIKSIENQNQTDSRSLNSLWFQPTIQFKFKYPKDGIGLIVEVFDMDDPNNQTNHDSIDFYGRTLLDLKLYPSVKQVQPQRIFLRSLFGMYTNLTVEFSLFCSTNFYGNDCEVFCLPNEKRYDCHVQTGEKICKEGFYGSDCLSDVRACEDEPCQNNGTCLVYLQSYRCQCRRGFSGRSCEIVLNPTTRIVTSHCNSTNCVHGVCTKSGKCLCHENWTSEHCNESLLIDHSGCSARPCLHNATCETLTGVNPTSAYRCHCRTGFTGRNCEIEIISTCERTPCIHGQCIKIDSFTEICACEKHWGGADCSRPLIVNLTSPIVETTMKMKTNPKLELNDYLNWLNINYGIQRTSSTPRNIPKIKPLIHDKFTFTPCLSAPCLHNSTCVVRSEHSFQCLCLPTFIGIFCEIERNPCESSPCQHQGVCIGKSNHNIQCLCRPHYTGKFCEYPIPFQPISFNGTCQRKCFNGGICLIVEPKGEQCVCRSSFTGSFCETRKTNCSTNDSTCQIDICSSNPCLFNSTCLTKPNENNYTCLCSPNQTGQRCEFDLNLEFAIDLQSKSSENNSINTTDLWPLAIVFGYIFSLMLVFIIIWFLWYGLTIRPQSYIHSDIPYEDRVSNRYQPYRLGVSNPLFNTNQEYSTPMSKRFLTPPTTISNLDQWTRTITR